MVESLSSSLGTCGEYQLEEQIAGGRLTEVYLGHIRGAERCVVKRLRDLQTTDGRESIKAEATALADIRHPNVVVLVDTIEDSEGPFAVVCEHLRGPTLGWIIANHGPAPWFWVVGLLTAALRGLAAVHNAGYLHLDITPANIVCVGFTGFDQPATPRLIDFGLARRLHAPSDGSSLTGTPGYVAPERLRGDLLDERADLYCLGAVAFELLTGVPPFRAPARGPTADQSAPRVVETNPMIVVPAALERMIASLLDADPKARPRTAEDLQQRLAALPPAPSVTVDAAPDLQLASLARHVRDSWLTGVLDASTRGLTLIPQALRLTTATGTEAVPLDAKVSLARVFERANGRMQIIGPAGYGKTVQTLKVLRRLLDDYQRQPERPVPVVFGMSEWREADTSLVEFMVRQLAGKYTIPATHARRFIEQDRIIALLDALDEIRADHREVAVRAINLYLTERPSRQALVNFRSDTHALREQLEIEVSVELCPLERAETARYLAGEWQRLRALLGRDAELEQLSHTPLMLQLMRVSARDEGFAARPESDEAAVHWLYRRYVGTILADRRGHGIDEARLLTGLGSVAGTLRRCDRAMLVFEELQPSALANPRLRALYLWWSRMSVATILSAAGVPVVALSPLDNSGFQVTVIFAVSLGLATSLVAGMGFVAWSRVPARVRGSVPAILMWGAVLGVLAGLVLMAFDHLVVWVFAIEAVLMCTMVLGVSRRARSFPNDDIATVEYLRWDFRGVASRTWALVVATALALWFGFRQFETTTTALQVAGIFSVVAAAIVASRHGRIEHKVTPNLGIHRSLRSALLAAGLGFAVAAMAFALSYELGYAMIGGLFVATVGGLWFGGIDVIQHYSLRVLLALDRSLSLRPSGVLEDAVRLGFLRRVGNGYMFAHSSLRDHFAGRSGVQ